MEDSNKIDIEAINSYIIPQTSITQTVNPIMKEIETNLKIIVPVHRSSDAISNGDHAQEQSQSPSTSKNRNTISRTRIKKKIAPDPLDTGDLNDIIVENSDSGQKTSSADAPEDETTTKIEEARDRRREIRARPRRSSTDIVRDQRKFYQKFPDLIAKLIKPSDWSQILVINLATMVALTGSILFSIRPPTSSTDAEGSNTEDLLSYLNLLPNQRTITNELSNVTIEVIDPNYGSIIPTILAVLTIPWTYNLLNTYGRKKMLLLATLPQILAGLLVGSDNIYVFYFTRFLSGLSDSISYIALPTFIGEVATPHVRGTWGNAMAVNTYLGNSILNAVESFLNVSITSYVLVLLPIVLIIVFACFPEPPHYYLLKDKYKRAWKSLKFLRRSGDIDEEFKSIKEDVDIQKNENVPFKHLFSNIRHRKSLLVAIMLRFCEQFCGIGALRLYTLQIFRETWPNISFNEATLIYSVFMTVSTTLSSFYLCKIGRRRAMCVSSYGCAVFLFLIALYYYLYYETLEDVSRFYWVPMFSLVGFIPMYALGLGTVPTLILGEIFAINIKARALCVMHVTFTTLIAAMDVMFYYLFTNFGMCTPFFFYSSSCLISLVLNYFFLPDMDDLTLEEIQGTMKAAVKETAFARLKVAIRTGKQKWQE